MKTIYARNVNDAYVEGLRLLREGGVYQSSRAGAVLVYPTPVATVYANPQERVLFDEKRDAHPGFHLFEALWMLAGRNDAAWLDLFVKDFSARFAEENGLQHGAYGYRWRNHFADEYGADFQDQLATCVRLLRTNPNDRQAVITMWDPIADLGATVKDKPCNTHIYLRVQERPYLGVTDQNSASIELSMSEGTVTGVLDITVCCRSNDAIWGAYGANAVHFSVLQEYLAARIGVKIGTYYQVSNNFHGYLNVLEKVGEPRASKTYIAGVQPTPIVEDAEGFDADLQKFFLNCAWGNWAQLSWNNNFFPRVALPLYRAFSLWRAKDYDAAREQVLTIPAGYDWREATLRWMQRRLDRRGAQK